MGGWCMCVHAHTCFTVCVLLQTPWGEDLVIEITTDCHAHSQKLENNPSEKNSRRTQAGSALRQPSFGLQNKGGTEQQ